MLPDLERGCTVEMCIYVLEAGMTVRNGLDFGDGNGTARVDLDVLDILDTRWIDD